MRLRVTWLEDQLHVVLRLWCLGELNRRWDLGALREGGQLGNAHLWRVLGDPALSKLLKKTVLTGHRRRGRILCDEREQLLAIADLSI